jgi:acyl carrier protein
MVDINDFIVNVEEEFEDMPKGGLKPESVIREHFTWDSINALIFIAHINVNYDVEITAQDLVDSSTIQDLYNVIRGRKEAAATA